MLLIRSDMAGSNSNHTAQGNINYHVDTNENPFAAFGISHNNNNSNNLTNGDNTISNSNALLNSLGLSHAGDTSNSISQSQSQSHSTLPITLSLTNNNNHNSTNPNNSHIDHQNSNSTVQNNNTSTTTSTTTTSTVPHGNTNSANLTAQPNVNLKNIRHYVYSANQPHADELLQLDLPDDISLPQNPDEKELKQRKDRNGLFSIRLTPFIDNVSTTNQGLYFDPIIRTAGPGSQLVIGRYTERVREAISRLPENYHPVVFKSKVISRTHGCFKVDSQGNWFVKDVKSSSGTFLNQQRLSPASTLSKDILLHDGDILQLGMDFRGGTEEIYRCVKMRIELNKSWKRKANAFNKEALQKIKDLQKLTNGGLDEEDCSICLSKIKPCQAIFISPCSHNWHFHCVRRLVMSSYPQFVCPNCRSACDLEATLESSDSEEEEFDSAEENEPPQHHDSNNNINLNSNNINQINDHDDDDDSNKNSDENSDNDSQNTNEINRNINHPILENAFDQNNQPNIAINNNQLNGNLLNVLGIQFDDPKNDIEMND